MKKRDYKNKSRKEEIRGAEEMYENLYWSERMNRKLKRSIRIFNNKKSGHFKKLKPAIAFSLIAFPVMSSLPKDVEARNLAEVKNESKSIDAKKTKIDKKGEII